MTMKKITAIKIISTFFVCAVSYTGACLYMLYNAEPLQPKERKYVHVIDTSQIMVNNKVAPEDMECIFYIRSEYGRLVIYNDNNSIYDTTNIELSSLPVNVQAAVLNVLQVNTLRELYDFLETYSS